MPELGYMHGVSVKRVPEGTLSFTIIDQATVAIGGTAPDADPDIFPLNQPVGLTGDLTQIAALGASGTLRDQVNALAVACGGQYLPKTAIVRVEEGATTEATIANLIGNAGSLTGWHAFKSAKSELGFKPKLYMFPGFTSQRIGGQANPLVASIVPWLERQRVMMLAAAPSTTKEAAIEYRDDIGSMCVEIIDPRVLVSGEDGFPIVRPAEPYVAGLGVKIIRDGDAVSHKPAGYWSSWSNAVIGGIVGTERPISFDYSDFDTESHLLNENRINTIVKEDGLRYWGGLTASSDDDWMFANVVRSRHAVEEMIAKGARPVIDAPMQAPAVVEMMVSLDEKLKDIKTAGAIIGGRAFFVPNENSGGNLRRGQVRIEFDAEETPPIHGLTVGSHRNKKYFDVFVDDVVRELAAI